MTDQYMSNVRLFAIGALVLACFGALLALQAGYWDWEHLGYRRAAILVTASGAFLAIVFCAVTAWLTSGRTRIAGLMGLYLALIVFYAGIYHFVYLIRPTSFTFSESVVEASSLRSTSATRVALRRLVDSEYLVTMLLGAPDVLLAAIAEKGKVSTGGGLDVRYQLTEHYRYDVYLGAELSIKRGRMSSTLGGSIKGPGGWHVWPVKALAEVRTEEKAREVISGLLDSLQAERLELIAHLEWSLSQHPDVELFDFLYFSVVTMTTLGYGDIIPNDHVGRGLVATQAVAGVLFLGYALILIEARGVRNTSAGDAQQAPCVP